MAFMYDAFGNPIEEGQGPAGWDMSSFTTGAQGQQGVAPEDSWQFNGGGDQGNGGWTNSALPQETYGGYLSSGGSGINTFGDYSNTVSGLPTLSANAFDNWESDPFLNKMMGTADKGAQYRGLSALVEGMQNLGAVTGVVGNFGDYSAGRNLSDDSYRQLAALMGISTNSPDWKQQVLTNSDNFALVKGMGGLNPDDERSMNSILYRRGDNGWNPVLNKSWHEREKGSWWDEGGSMIMVPLSIVAGGALSTLGSGGAAAGAGGGITGTAGASGAAAYGSTGLAQALGGGGFGAGLSGGASAIAPTLGTAAGGATGLAGTIANQLGVGGQFSSLPSWAQGALNSALQGAGNSALSGNNPLEGALTGAIGGALSPAINSGIRDLGLGQFGSGALSGAVRGGLNSVLGGGNPLTGAVMGGIGGGTAGGLQSLGADSGFANVGSRLAQQVAGSYLQDQIRDEVFQGRQDLLNGLYDEAARRGISRQQIEAFLQTPQGRQAIQQLIAQQGKGTLQQLFG